MVKRVNLMMGRSSRANRVFREYRGLLTPDLPPTARLVHGHWVLSY